MQKLKGDIEERILASARDQFLRHGYSKASMRGIASAAGVSTGNLYNYFPNKDELFRRVVAPAITLLEEMLRTAGFRRIKQYGERKLRRPAPGEQRIFFAARKDF